MTVLNTLTDETSGAITISAVDKKGLKAWLAAAPARDRAWLKTLGFTAEQGKFAVLPGAGGRPSRVVVGADLARDPLLALAGLPDTLPGSKDPLPAQRDSER